MNNKQIGEVGRPISFSAEEEQSFAYLNLFDLRCIVKSYLDTTKKQIACFKNNFPGFDWSKLFLERHKKGVTGMFCQEYFPKASELP